VNSLPKPPPPPTLKKRKLESEPVVRTTSKKWKWINFDAENPPISIDYITLEPMENASTEDWSSVRFLICEF